MWMYIERRKYLHSRQCRKKHAKFKQRFDVFRFAILACYRGLTAPFGPFVYRLGRKIFILKRAVRFCYGLRTVVLLYELGSRKKQLNNRRPAAIDEENGCLISTYFWILELAQWLERRLANRRSLVQVQYSKQKQQLEDVGEIPLSARTIVSA